MNWDGMHKKGERPWDLKRVTPMLKNFFESEVKGKELIESKGIKRILIPGCGQKYDSEYLAKMFPEADVIGVDISPTAVKTCQEAINDSEIHNLKFIEADFFDSAGGADLGHFDMIFDHTFFCAIRPEIRPRWAERIKSLLSAHSAYLLTIIYPLQKQKADSSTEGPPFEVTFEAYTRILSDELVCCARWTSEQVPASSERRRGREELALWQRK